MSKNAAANKKRQREKKRLEGKKRQKLNETMTPDEGGNPPPVKLKPLVGGKKAVRGMPPVAEAGEGVSPWKKLCQMVVEKIKG